MFIKDFSLIGPGEVIQFGQIKCTFAVKTRMKNEYKLNFLEEAVDNSSSS